MIISVDTLCGFAPLVYPQIDKPFRIRCIDMYNSKASVALWVHPYSLLYTDGCDKRSLGLLTLCHAVGFRRNKVVTFDAIPYMKTNHGQRCIGLYSNSRGEPTELFDGNFHRNDTIQFWSNGITYLYRKYMVFPLRDHFIIENGLLD